MVAGGDGTVARAARALDGRDVTLAILPTGTANNIARALGLDRDVHAIISRLPKAKPKRLDVGIARGPWGKRRFLESVGFGSIARAIANSDSSPKLPIELRIHWGREDLRHYLEEAAPEALQVTIDSEVFTGDFLLVEVLNLGRTGPALPIASTAAYDDGHFDVVFLFKSDRVPMLAWLEIRSGFNHFSLYSPGL